MLKYSFGGSILQSQYVSTRGGIDTPQVGYVFKTVLIL